MFDTFLFAPFISFGSIRFIFNVETCSFGTQQPIASLKQLFETGVLFNSDNGWKWKLFEDIRYFCAMTTAADSGKNQLDERFVSLCALMNISQMPYIRDIYQAILCGPFSSDLHPTLNKLMKITVNLFKVWQCKQE